jgi:DNA polymerase III sliding clamp (beta) subunit (PCNA family)
MFSLPQPLLANMLKRLFFALDPHAKIEGVAHIKIDASGDTVSFAAASSKITAEAVLPAGAPIPERMFFGTAGTLLKNLVTSFDPASYVTVKLDGSTVFIKTATSTFRLPVLDPELIPARTAYGSLKFGKVDMPAFLKGVTQVMFCSNKDGTHDYQKGVCLNREHFVATDGFRLACYPNKVLPVDSMMLPLDSALSLTKMYPSVKDGGMIVSPTEMHTYGDGLYSSIRLLAAAFPDYRSILPTSRGITYEFDRKVFLPPVERLSYLATKLGSFIRMSFNQKEQMLYLMAETDLGKGYEALPCPVTLDYEVSLNLKQVVASIEKFDEDKFTLELFTPPHDGKIVLRSGEAFHVISTVQA